MAAFEPLASLLVENGISTPEAESLLRSVIVHGVYQREFQSQGKKVSYSRIALLTGVHRNEVKRILSTPPRIDPEREVRRHRANRILAAWHEDPDYNTLEATPRELPVKAKKRKDVSFWRLVEQYAPGVWPKLILNELLRVGAVEQRPNHRLQVRMRSYGVAGQQTEAIEELGRRSRDLLETLVHNIKQPAASRVCETALTLDTDPKWIPVLRNTLLRRAQTFMAAVNEDLNSQRIRRKQDDTAPAVRIGLTVYSFEEENAKETGNGTKKKNGRPPRKSPAPAKKGR